MDPDQRGRRLLRSASIGMLAVRGQRYPLVNPVAYQYAAGSVWMTTSRRAVKVELARKDPRASFLITGGGVSVFVHGLLEVYDPLSLSGQVRAALEAPRFYSSLARYGLKNANFIGGYLLDITRIPSEWWPQNRVVLRLRVNRARTETLPAWPSGHAATVPDVPAPVKRALDGVSTSYLCWGSRGTLVVEPCMWAPDGEDAGVVVALGKGGLKGPSSMVPAALVVESHHPYRATRMIGACLRGPMECDDGAAGPLQERYGAEADALGSTLRIRPDRVTWWRGFKVATTHPSRAARERAAV